MIDAVEFLVELLEIPSPSKEEKKLTSFLKRKLEEWGYQAEVDRAGNVVASLGEEEPTLLLASHVDTVPDFLPVRKENGRIFGRGAVDAKASIAAMALAGVEAFRWKPKGKLIFAGVVEEEASLNGIQTLLEELPQVNYAIFGEPTGLNRICLASKGRLLLKIDVHTSSGHVACSWKHKNAVEEAFELWLSLKNVLSIEGKSYFTSVIPNLTVFHGGSAPNVVSDHCSFYIDVRFPPTVSAAHLLGISVKVIDDFSKSKKVDVKYEVLSQIEGFRASRRSSIVEALARSIKEEVGKEAKFIKKTGTCFMNLIGRWFNIPVVSYGPGDPALEHTNEENILIEEYLTAIRVLTKTVRYTLA